MAKTVVILTFREPLNESASVYDSPTEAGRVESDEAGDV